MDLVFASHNKHKRDEVVALLRPQDHVYLASECMQLAGEIPEDYQTLEENSAQKARFLYDALHCPVFSDDTGLEVLALNGAPGVYSARYAGNQCSFEDNMRKLLHELSNISDRRACFRTVVTLIINDELHQFEGRVDGEILTTPTGKQGFGYDPIFRPEGYTQSFAELDLTTKNRISHRGLAIKKMVEFLHIIDPRP